MPDFRMYDWHPNTKHAVEVLKAVGASEDVIIEALAARQLFFEELNDDKLAGLADLIKQNVLSNAAVLIAQLGDDDLADAMGFGEKVRARFESMGFRLLYGTQDVNATTYHILFMCSRYHGLTPPETYAVGRVWVLP